MNTRTKIAASILALGLIAGTAFAQTGTGGTQAHNKMTGSMANGGMMNGGMMGMQGKGMMGNHHGKMGMGCMGMMGGGMMQKMTPAQRQLFLTQTVDLRKQMMEKRFAYMEAMRNPKSTPQDLAKVEKEMLSLRTQMMNKMQGLTKQ